jgi:peptidyl-prolyl cis-trans isomerase D
MMVARDQPQNLSPELLKSIPEGGSRRPCQTLLRRSWRSGLRRHQIKTAPWPVPATKAGLKQDRAQYGQWWTNAENLAYYGVLKERVKVDVRVPKPLNGVVARRASPQVT